MQTDDYKGYDGFEESAGVIHVGCFAHARRKFDEAQRGQGKKAKVGKNVSLARQGLHLINTLYKIERSYASTSCKMRTALRAEKLAPKIEALHEWAPGRRLASRLRA